MKKISLLLLVFWVTPYLITCSDSGIEIPTLYPRVHIDDHIATIAALVASTASLEKPFKALYYKPIGSLINNLITETDCFAFFETSKKYTPLLFPKNPSETTFCVFLSPDKTDDTFLSKKNRAVIEAASTKPIAAYTTHTKEYRDLDKIKIVNHTSKQRNIVTISHLNKESEAVHISTTSYIRAGFSYTISDTISSSLMPTYTPFLHHDILLAACPTDNPAKQLVAIWAFPQKP